MTRIFIFCEGQTEETFVRELLHPYFESLSIWLYPVVFRTGREGKGGVSTYAKLKSQIERKCKEDSSAWVTSFLDLYGLPKDFPKLNKILQKNNLKQKVDTALEIFEEDINQPSFIPYLSVHEFEGLLFSDLRKFESWVPALKILDRLINMGKQFKSPEHVNNSIDSAPSKRILSIWPSYKKVHHGISIASDIGLNMLREKCYFFNKWIESLEEKSTARLTSTFKEYIS